jgi:hypothetical protein
VVVVVMMRTARSAAALLLAVTLTGSTAGAALAQDSGRCPPDPICLAFEAVAARHGEAQERLAAARAQADAARVATQAHLDTALERLNGGTSSGEGGRLANPGAS